MDPERQRLYLELLECALLNARAAAWANDPQQAAREVDHVHNLPALLADYDPQREEHYLAVEYPAYLHASGPKASREIARLVGLLRQPSSVTE